ncbi:nucleolar MIF4G domain-containing protein 1 homolog [Drosophila hydei]|uniref:Nucleolar MIF4G domain-containing protein 1 homolog n=1 Tax=Drosophila hydei TaxID=7224 RepID=A0A6J1M1Z2_DROHY|nr:nucleolar MIF4G domain-containing protein 1 homolog [Drosophila hydei]
MVKLKKKEAQAPKKPLSRKEQRKLKQERKKNNKRIYHADKANGAQRVAEAAAAAALAANKNGRKKKKPKKKQLKPEEISREELLAGEVDDDNDESIASDFSDAEVDARLPADRKVEIYEPVGKKPKKHAGIQRLDEMEVRKRELRQQKELLSKSRKQRLKKLKLENEEEDKEIAKLEKKLKLNKTKDKNRSVRKMFNDGLDYLLDFVLDDEEEKQKWEEKQRRKKELKEQQEKEEAGMWSDDEDEPMDLPDEDSETEEVDGENDLTDQSEMEEDAEGLESNSEVELEETEKTTYKEDIYGRRIDAEGNILPDSAEVDAKVTGQKYIPPHQRALLAANENSSAQQAEQLARLQKQCKGLLNRLSEANLHKISSGIETLYMKNSRYNMNETLTKLLQEALLGRSRSNERMVQEHMVLLAFLHAHIGSEIGAHFLQTFVEQFDGFVREIDALDVEDKRLNNLVLILCYMYIFKIYEQRLLLELIARLAGSLCEKSVECLLLIFQTVGFRLRKDDPLAFKNMMQNVQSQIAASPLELKENPRLRFMVDILNAVKNNNMSKLPQYDPELAEMLRKRLKGMLRNERYVVTLNITLEDLLRADKLGKWWIVGSAWAGNLAEMGTAQAEQEKQLQQPRGERYSEKLLQLAKKQHMNTAERRSIFCIIMSAADYVDAFEKILHLSLKDQRTVAYVIIHCALNERHANPYYAHLALKFCQYNRKFQLAFQFASWDRINDIETLSKVQIRNFASFLQQLILSAGLQLSVLKVVDFMQLHKLSFYFMREIMTRLLLSSEETQLYQAFERITKNSKLQQFKQSIRLFMQHFMLEKLEEHKEEQQQVLRQRIEHLDKLLAYVDL